MGTSRPMSTSAGVKDEHHKLSKRNGDASFQDLVAKGYLPEAILNYIALLGWSPETRAGDLYAG